MFEEHRSFHPPTDDTVLWRYLSIDKLKDLLESNSLYFNRSDKFLDTDEGTLNVKDYEKVKVMLSNFQKTKQFYFLNCWHMAENESEKMWGEYTNNNGVAIKSSVRKLKTALQNTEDQIYFSSIEYIEFDQTSFDSLITSPINSIFNGKGSSMNQFNYKAKKYEHEREMRAIFIDLPIPHTIKNGIPRTSLEYKKVNVDCLELIEEIRFSPFLNESDKAYLKKNVCSMIKCVIPSKVL